VPLDISTIQPGMVIRAAHLTQYFNVLTGIIQDQPVSLAHQLTVGGGAVIGPGIVPFTVRSQTAQTANVIEVRDPTSTLVFAVSSSGSITLEGTLQAGAVTVTGNLTVDGYVVAPLNIGTPNERITNPANNPANIAMSSSDGYAFVEGHQGAHLAGNAFWDGVNWNLFDTTTMGTVFVAAPSGLVELFSLPAGTNPRTPAMVMTINYAGVIGGNLSFANAITFNGNVSYVAPIVTNLTVNGNLTMAGTYLLLARGADPAPYTQERLAIYNDGTNWAYFAYGQDAVMRVVYSSGGAGLSMGTSSASNNTGGYAQRLYLDPSGNLSVTAQLAGGSLSVSGNASVGGTLSAAGGSISNLSVVGTITTSAINSADWFRLSQANVGIYDNVTGTGIQFVAGGQLLYPSGDQIAGLTTAQTLTNKTIVNMKAAGPAAFGANGNDLTNYTFNYYSSTMTLPAPSAAYAGVFRAVRAWGAAVTINCPTASLIPPGQYGTVTAAFVLNNGDSITFWCDGVNWWSL
jgi:hypothetical protein